MTTMAVNVEIPTWNQKNHKMTPFCILRSTKGMTPIVDHPSSWSLIILTRKWWFQVFPRHEVGNTEMTRLYQRYQPRVVGNVNTYYHFLNKKLNYWDMINNRCHYFNVENLDSQGRDLNLRLVYSKLLPKTHSNMVTKRIFLLTRLCSFQRRPITLSALRLLCCIRRGNNFHRQHIGSSAINRIWNKIHKGRCVTRW